MNNVDKELRNRVRKLVDDTVKVIPVPNFMKTKFRAHISTFTDRVVEMSSWYTNKVVEYKLQHVENRVKRIYQELDLINK